MMALSGVRSSWDMFARNSDLCRLADLEVGGALPDAALEAAVQLLDLVEQPTLLPDAHLEVAAAAGSRGRRGRATA